MRLAICLALGFAATDAGAAIVAENRVTAELGYVGGNETTALLIDQEFGVSGGANRPDFTGAIFELVSTTAHDYRFGGAFADSGVDVYFVGELDAFSAPSVAAGDFQKLTDFQVYDFSFFNDVYLGFVMPSAAAGFGPHPPAYAWARVASGEMNVGDPRQLFVLETATAFDSQGIIVGTTQSIPEPGGLALAVVGLMALGLRRRRSAVMSPPAGV